MKKVIEYLTEGKNNQKEARFLQQQLAAFVIYKVVFWFADFNLFFSDSSIIYKNEVNLSWWRQPIFILFNSNSEIVAYLFLFILIVAAIFILMKPRFSSLLFAVLWFVISNINNAVFCSLSGGDYLFQHLLFFAIFLGTDWSCKNQSIRIIQNVIHNNTVIAIKIQICLVYFLAGYAKLLDSDWIHGTAISTVFSIKDFSLPFMYNLSGMSLFLGYSVILYQLLFPILVWIESIKKWFLLIGIIQHLIIAFIIGLPSFGLIMIIAYAIFYTPLNKQNLTNN